MHCPCHGQNALCVCFKSFFKAVLGKFALDIVARAAHAGSVRTAALNNKAVDDAVEDQSVIVAFWIRLIKLFTVFGAISG